MRRTVLLPLVFTLALVTGVALLGVAFTVTDGAATPNPGNANAAVVQRFYDAANTLLQTGTATALEDVLAPAFIDHQEREHLAPTDHGLIPYFIGLRASYPTLRLTALEMIAQGDRVAVRVQVEGADDGEFLSLPIHDGPAPWGSLDVFRVEDGRISDHWSGLGSPMLLEPLFQAPLFTRVRLEPDTNFAPTFTVQVKRLQLIPDAITKIAADVDTVLLLEKGSLDVSIVSMASAENDSSVGRIGQDAIRDRQDKTLGSGEVLTVPAGMILTLHNNGEVPAEAVITTASLDLFPEVAPSGPPSETPESASEGSNETMTIVAELHSTIRPDDGRLHMAAGRATLAPGGRLVVGATAGLAMLVVERGTLTVDGEMLGVGESHLLQSAGTAELRNDGTESLTLLLVSVLSDGSDDAPATGP